MLATTMWSTGLLPYPHSQELCRRSWPADRQTSKFVALRGTLPRYFKVGNGTPLLKKPGTDTVDTANYRSITNLNTIGMLVEHIVQKQLRRHIETSPNVGPLQSAYRALYSTETAMTRVVSDLLTATDSRTPSVLLSLDISAAFDILDHR